MAQSFKKADGGKVAPKQEPTFTPLLPRTVAAPRDVETLLMKNPDFARAGMGIAPTNLEIMKHYENQLLDYFDGGEQPRSYVHGKDDISLTQGTMRGGKAPRKMVQDLADAADRENIPRSTMIALAANESMFGKKGATPQEIVSAWDVARNQEPMEVNKFLAMKGVPGIKLIKSRAGYAPEVSSTAKKSMDSAMAKHPEWIEEYRMINKDVRPPAQVDYLGLTAKMVRERGLKKMNSGAPNYQRAVEIMENNVKQEPGLQPYLKKKADGGQLDASPYVETLDQQAEGGSVTPLSSNSGVFRGPSHERGGIDLPGYGAEVEGDESIADDYIFSHRLGFAQKHIPLARAKGKIEAKPQTPERVNSLRRLGAAEDKLKQLQELVKTWQQ